MLPCKDKISNTICVYVCVCVCVYLLPTPAALRKLALSTSWDKSSGVL